VRTLIGQESNMRYLLIALTLFSQLTSAGVLNGFREEQQEYNNRILQESKDEQYYQMQQDINHLKGE
jgi:hypothetical protein